jgi:hypothetical protein
MFVSLGWSHLGVQNDWCHYLSSGSVKRSSEDFFGTQTQLLIGNLSKATLARKRELSSALPELSLGIPTEDVN